MASSSGPEKLALNPVQFWILDTEAVFDLVRFFALFSFCDPEYQWSGGVAVDRLQSVSHSCHSRVCHAWRHLNSVFSVRGNRNDYRFKISRLFDNPNHSNGSVKNFHTQLSGTKQQLILTEMTILKTGLIQLL